MWDLPGSGMELVFPALQGGFPALQGGFPALQGGFVTTGPPGKLTRFCFFFNICIFDCLKCTGSWLWPSGSFFEAYVLSSCGELACLL